MDKIRVEDLTFSYDGERNAVNHVSFSVEDGAIQRLSAITEVENPRLQSC